MLISRTVIENLNAQLKKLALAKVDHLQQKLQLRKGIHNIGWHLSRLDLEIRDKIETTREIQLMRVSKNIVDITGVPEEERMRKEIETEVYCGFRIFSTLYSRHACGYPKL